MKEWGLARRERRRRLMCLGNVGSHGKRQRFPGLLSSGPSRGLPLLYPVLLCDFSLTLRIHYYTHTHTHTHFFCLTSLMEFIPCNKSLCCKRLKHPLPTRYLSTLTWTSSVQGPGMPQNHLHSWTRGWSQIHPYSPIKMWKRPSFAFAEPVIVLIVFLPLNKWYVRVLTPSTLECDLIRHQVFIEVIKSKEVISVSPNPTLLLERDMHTGETPCADGGRDWDNTPTSKEYQRLPANHWKWRYRPSQLSEGPTNTAQHHTQLHDHN